ncbi:MAG: hypothetical protein ACRDTV_26755, partial [Mycobacterium sp.]
LDDLLRTREQLAATIDGVDECARADATPTEEIIRIRPRRKAWSVKARVDYINDIRPGNRR